MKTHGRTRWLAAALAAAVWFSAGAGSVARAYTVEVTNLFQIVAASAQWGPVAEDWPTRPAETQSSGEDGFWVHLRVKCDLWDSVPTGVELTGPDGEPYGMAYESLKDTDYILFRLAVDQGSYPGWGERLVPTYLRAQACSFNYDFWWKGVSIFADTNCLVDEYYPGDYVKVPVGALREENGYFDVWWMSQWMYPTEASWICQCLLEKRGMKFYLDGALVCELASSDVPTVLKTASAVDMSGAGRTVSAEVDLVPNPEDIPGGGDEPWTLHSRTGGSSRGEYGVSAKRHNDGTLEITYTTLGNDVDYYWNKTFDHEGTGLSPKDGRWLVTFVHVDPDGERHPIPTAELSFEEDSPSMDFPVRHYPNVVVTETDSGYRIEKTMYSAGMGFEPMDETYSYELPTNPATYKLVWNNPYAEGYIEAWVSYKNLRTAFDGQVLSDMGLADWFFGDRVVGGTTWTPATTSYTLTHEEFAEALAGIDLHHKKIVHSPLPFGEYREGRSALFQADRRVIDLWAAFRGTEPILESDGLSYLQGWVPAFSSDSEWNWRVDGVTQFTTHGVEGGRAAWEPRERGMHVLDLEHNGVLGKVSVWFDEPRWAPLPEAGPNAVPGPKAESLYPWTNEVAIDVAVDALDPRRTVSVTGEWKTGGGDTPDQDEWQRMWHLGYWGVDWTDGYAWVWAEDGVQKLRWDTAAELGSGIAKKDAEVRMTIEWDGCHELQPDKYGHPLQYLVVDVSGGPDAERWPVTVLCRPPYGGWGDEYKTDKIVLRRVVHGDFTMGSPEGEPYRNAHAETQHAVRLTETYYVGVFEITQAQWEHVMGGKPPCWSESYSDGRLPVRNVSYDDLRGEKLGRGWPEHMGVDGASFFGRLREKASGLAWDLPTEAQWEMACRAGTQTAWNDGSEMDETDGEGGAKVDAALSQLGRYRGDWSDGAGGYSGGPTVVGSYQPNQWGIYDMHGNVSEWVRDRVTDEFGDERADDGAYVDPKGNADLGYGYHGIRGGSYSDNPERCRSAWRFDHDDDTSHDRPRPGTGFRAGAFVWPFGLD